MDKRFRGGVKPIRFPSPSEKTREPLLYMAHAYLSPPSQDNIYLLPIYFRMQSDTRNMYWCAACGDWFLSEVPVCTRCSLPMSHHRCTRCGHEWRPRDMNTIPGSCPKCKSPYWNRPRATRRGPMSIRRARAIEAERVRMEAIEAARADSSREDDELTARRSPL